MITTDLEMNHTIKIIHHFKSYDHYQQCVVKIKHY